MRIIRSRLFLDSLKALQRTDPPLFEVVAADLRYLLERRRDAQLPHVRFGIVQSAFRDVMGEVRSHIPDEPAFMRTLFVMPEDQTLCALLVMGDKNTADGHRGTPGTTERSRSRTRSGEPSWPPRGDDGCG
jgi:hypothetical protein